MTNKEFFVFFCSTPHVYSQDSARWRRESEVRRRRIIAYKCQQLCIINVQNISLSLVNGDIEKFSLYFTHLPSSPQWTDLHEIFHGGSSRRRNHLCQILCWSIEGFRICAGSNFAILCWLSRSPLTQGWRYRAACDDMIMTRSRGTVKTCARFQF